MSVPKDVTWDRDPHTAAKHALLRRYLQAWAPIMLRYNDTVVYAEGFAGPGVYRGGEQGSPVVAYHVLASALQDRPGRVQMVLLEEDPRRKAELEQHIAAAARSRRLRSGRLDVRIGQGSCHPVLLEELTRTDSMRRPMFVLLDGFGGPEVPFDLLRRIADAHHSNEVMVTFQPSFLFRFAEKNEQHRAAGDAFFGDSDWHGVFQQPSSAKAAYLRDQYRTSLQQAGFQHTLAFEMIDEGSRLLYLIFGTRHERGVEKMKEAMWAVDSTSGVRYRDPKDPNQQALDLELEPDTGPLRRILLEHLRTAPAPLTVDQLKRYTLLETVYRPTQVIPLLKRMRDEQQLTVSPGRIIGTTTVTAVPQDALF
ncbi:three-Cys-motif partner protein [Kitasatospora sp. SolWspMP-SS2h]|uniref:three-Cys-motif partner protein TcmP n=1 Tax=Kitasatospora sp. SolWspMP-SS2h TaxID=1305729 RepID=UPI000DB9DE95|nr:three-Cys-motif partner protein TcmP [Kitasatospora sp. SolWspMP-SS2h]RAJ44774.1 three-Cys-motif partner protein [Kitasatospora sp. SolWspMP-SS2h]